MARGRKPGSKNRPKVNNNTSLEDLDLSLMDQEKKSKKTPLVDQEIDDEQDDESDDGIITFDQIDDLKYKHLFARYGIRIDRKAKNVEVWERDYYAEDQVKVNKITKEEKFLLAGTHGNWGPRPIAYLVSIPSAIDYVARKVFNKKFKEKQTFVGLKNDAKEIRDLLTNILEV